MKPILEIQNISKKFIINHELQSYLSIRDSLRLSNFFTKRSINEDFWALKDINFNVGEGETIGIIGKNGAGKSTLLKILSKITPPTYGKIIGRGRVASLLEVGTGFHSELSGRENVFMNGSILGMKRIEIVENFDAIVDFSGVEKFIDTPLKHYSSGMQLRLAFAVAAFLKNEILIIDEVLAVGDADFQKKCMGKMDDVSKSGRTIIFVSHNMGAVSQLCKKGIYLRHGLVEQEGSIDEIVNSYLSNKDDYENNAYVCQDPKSKECYFSEILTYSSPGIGSSTFGFDENVRLGFKISTIQLIDSEAKISVTLLDKYQSRVFTVVRLLTDFENTSHSTKEFYLTLPKGIIAPNIYSFRYALFNDSGKVYDLLEGITIIKIVDTGTHMTKYEGVDYGSVILECIWSNV